jgi:hypothetical protein
MKQDYKSALYALERFKLPQTPDYFLIRHALRQAEAAEGLFEALKQLYRNGQKQGWHDAYETDMKYAEQAISAWEKIDAS